MTHNKYRLDETTAAIHTERDSGGGVLEIRCRAEDGRSTRLSLQLTNEGIDRLADLVARFASSTPEPEAARARTPAAEPTSAAANTDQTRHVERYAVVQMTGTEVANLVSALKSRGVETATEEEDWHERVVVWRVPDGGVSRPDDACFRVYVSPGAVNAARRQEIRIDPVGEVSRTDLPADRELLTGDPPLDWQDTAH
jgi:hypothetical protein